MLLGRWNTSREIEISEAAERPSRNADPERGGNRWLTCTIEPSPLPTYDYLVRFRGPTGNIVVTVRVREVEQVFCSQDGGIAVADLTQRSPVFVPVSLQQVQIEPAGWRDNSLVDRPRSPRCTARRPRESFTREVVMRIGIVGAGMIGSTMAKLWAEAGHEVRVSSRHPDQLRELVEQLGERVSAGSAEEAAVFGQVVMLTVPLKAVPGLARDLAQFVAGKIVLDTGNAYDQRDGVFAREARAHPRGSAGWAAAMFPNTRWVKAFNSVYFKTLLSEAHRQGDQIGIPLASDFPSALETAASLVRDAGFDPVIVGSLERGKEFEPETPPYNTGMSGPDLRNLFEWNAAHRA